MSLEIVVCLKQVPHPDHFSQISLDPAKQTITREGIPAVINPLDKNALEQGLRLREHFSGRVTVISMGPPQTQSALEEALAMGADRGVLLCDRAFAGADTLATAHALALAVRKLEPFDLILCGNETIDSATGQVGPQLAEVLDIPHVTYVQEVALAHERRLAVRRAMEYGYMKVEVTLPALLAMVKESNRPRLPTVWGIMEAAQKEIRLWTAADVGATPEAVGLEGSPTRVIGVFEQQARRRGEVLEGAPDEVARRAVAKLRELGAFRA